MCRGSARVYPVASFPKIFFLSPSPPPRPLSPPWLHQALVGRRGVGGGVLAPPRPSLQDRSPPRLAPVTPCYPLTASRVRFTHMQTSLRFDSTRSPAGLVCLISCRGRRFSPLRWCLRRRASRRKGRRASGRWFWRRRCVPVRAAPCRACCGARAVRWGRCFGVCRVLLECYAGSRRFAAMLGACCVFFGGCHVVWAPVVLGMKHATAVGAGSAHSHSTAGARLATPYRSKSPAAFARKR